jgi:hypothetical protein
MISSDELLSWAGDRNCQRATRAKARAILDDWAKSNSIRSFAADLARASRLETAEAVNAVQRLFVDDDWLNSLITRLIAELNEDPYCNPQFQTRHSEMQSCMLLWDCELVSMFFAVWRAEAFKNAPPTTDGATIQFSGQLSIIKFIRAGNATISWWEAPEISANFVGSKGRCRRVRCDRVADGQIIMADGRREAFAIESADADLVLLHANVKTGRAPVSVEYSTSTGEFAGCAAVDERSSRAQMMMTLLRTLHAEGAFEAIARCLDHPDFFVRWHAMRELLGIDADSAIPNLERMAAIDPHADTRATASSLLDRIRSNDVTLVDEA